MLISKNELDSKTSRELIPLECLGCGKTHYRTKNLIQRILKGSFNGTNKGCYCSIECKRIYKRIPKIKCNCKQCGNELERMPRNLTKNVFCNHTCSAKYNNIRKLTITNICMMCMIKFKPKRSNRNTKYCSPKCKQEYKIQEWNKKIESGNYKSAGSGNKRLKDYLIRNRGFKCEDCKLSIWKNLSMPLTIHHIDGNATNNLPYNLKLLCWNCHALTDNYGSKNKKSTRILRYI